MKLQAAAAQVKVADEVEHAFRECVGFDVDACLAGEADVAEQAFRERMM